MKLLETIEIDELTHVTAGLHWFKYVCAHASPAVEPIGKFHAIVRANFRGSLLPPFNTEARTKAGFTEEWYLPLAVKKEKPAPAAAPAPEAEAESAEEKKMLSPAPATAEVQ